MIEPEIDSNYEVGGYGVLQYLGCALNSIQEKVFVFGDPEDKNYPFRVFDKDEWYNTDLQKVLKRL